MCKEAPAARARGPRDQDISHRELAWKRIRPQSEEELGSNNLVVFLEGSTVKLTAPTPTIEIAARENASVKTPIGGRSVARAATREPKRARITGGHRGGEAEYRSGEREHCVFYLFFFMNFFTENTRNAISGDAQLYSQEYYKMLWMREARIRAFM